MTAPTTTAPAGSAGTTLPVAEHLIGAETLPAAGDRRLHRLDPATGEPSAVLVPATADEVDAAVAAADGARHDWRRSSAGERASALREAAAAVRREAPRLGELLTRSTGRLLRQSTESAVVAADLLEEAAAGALGATGRTLAGSGTAVDAVRREPHGVVGVITPWNDPFPAAAGLLGAALAMGNTVVHKPSERSAAPGWELGRLIAQALPAGVLNVVNGDGETGAAIVEDPRVALVAQVGSSATGRRIAAAVGARGGRVLLENGGKDPLVVDAGVDPAWAAEQIVLGAYTNTGQLCTAVERVYVHADIADAVTQALVELTERLVVGSPWEDATDLGPLVDEEQLAIVESHVAEALRAGARALTGGRRIERPGSYYPPTVLDGCTDEMTVVRAETFGPVAPLIRVADFAEGLRRAGSGEYGLAATVLTPDPSHGLLAMSELEVGTVKVNAVFGGAPGGSADPRRSSGSGVGYGPDLLSAMSLLKATHWEAARGSR